MKLYAKLAVLTAFATALTAFTACSSDDSSSKADGKGDSSVSSSMDDSKQDGDNTQGGDLNMDGYELVWEDNFDGDKLNRDDWNVELHEPGWVNAEWQEYVDSEDNIFIEDGKLVIRPIKTTDADGNDYYTSGRVSTQNKQDFTYGVFEARLKVPEGTGYLPAFWLMATDENVYGQWPRCGEIDIMEVHGSEPTTTYATLHYGNPHAQSQGSKKLDSGSFADEFHTFTVEWNPGKINWFVDGYLVHTENDWYSATEGQGELTYPAPFDQPFYMILNLAVGGSWVGYPDETTDFENARYEIDYVKVYQKDSYNEDVKKPEKEVTFREPDENGNFIVNGDFSVAEDLSDDENWMYHEEQGGKAELSIKDNQIDVIVATTGNVDYSVQLVQPMLPMRKGNIYEVSFDAYSSGERTMLVVKTAPVLIFIRYIIDTLCLLTTEKQTYKYQFTMAMDDDPNGRLEFNMGKVITTEDIFISNVSVKVVGVDETLVGDDSKTVLADGNYIYNGKFQEGEKHIGFWDITNDCGAEYSVTDFADSRKLSVSGNGITADKPFIISQSDLALGEGAYVFSADIEGEAGKTVNVSVGDESFDITLEDGKKTYTHKLSLTADTSKTFAVKFSDAGSYKIDNVSLTEDSLLKNGSFNAGLAGFEPYAYTASDVSWVVDSLTEDNAIDFTINNSGPEAWHIQLKQNGIRLENGQSYRLSFDAKSSVDRKIMFAIQRDGSKHNDDWTPYSGEEIVDLTGEYQHFELEFTMEQPTDSECVFSLSMGAVGGIRVSNQHRICIDNITLETIDSVTADTAE